VIGGFCSTGSVLSFFLFRLHFFGVCSTFNLGVNARGEELVERGEELQLEGKSLGESERHKSIGSASRIQTPFSPWFFGRLLVLVAIDHQRVPFGISLAGFSLRSISFLIILPRHSQPSLELGHTRTLTFSIPHATLLAIR